MLKAGIYRKKRRIGYRIYSILMILCMLTAVWPQSVSAAVYYEEGPETYGEAYCVMDAETGEILCAHNATEQHYPASITKVLTALVVIENTENLDATLEFSESAVTAITDNSSTLTPVACAGEKMSVRDCLYGLLLCSGNECANELAEYVAGSTEEFAKLMNSRAEEIGTVNSHFVNAHGLPDDNHYTCAYDMALIFREALKNSEFETIDSTATYIIPPTNKTEARTCTMGHKMINGEISYEGVYAGKTGRTVEAGRTLLTAAEHNGRKVVIALMKSDDDHFYEDAQNLLDYTYDILDEKIAGPWEWQGTEENETVNATGNVNIREKPTVHSSAIGTLKEGQEAVRTGYCNNWSRIEINGNVGYVNSAYLTPLVGNTQEIQQSASGAEETDLSAEETDTEPVSKEEQTAKEAEETDTALTETAGQTEDLPETGQDNVQTEETDLLAESTLEGQTGTDTTGDTGNSKQTISSDLIWPIVLIAVCAVLLLVIVIFVILYIKASRRKHRRRQMHNRNMHKL